MSLPIQDQANILHGIRGGWAKRSEIINTLLIREAAHQRTTIMECIGYKEEGSLLRRDMETPDRIEGLERQDNEASTQHTAIRVLTYTGYKWIVDLDPIKVQLDWHICTHENTWLRKVSWDPLQWTWCDPYAGQGSKPIPFFHFTTRLGHHIIAAQSARDPTTAKVWKTYHVPNTIITKFWQKLWKQQHVRRITTFQWLLIHKSLLVYAWQRGNLSSPNCVACRTVVESIRHALWDCPISH